MTTDIWCHSPRSLGDLNIFEHVLCGIWRMTVYLALVLLISRFKMFK